MPIFNRDRRFLRLFRLVFYLSLPNGILVLIISSLTDLALHQAIAAWAAAAAATMLMVLPVLSGLTLMPRFTEGLTAGNNLQPPNFGNSKLGRETAAALIRLERAWHEEMEALVQSVQTNEKIIELLPDPLIILDDNRMVIRANRSARREFGEDITGRNLATIFRAPEVLVTWSDALETGSSTQSEFTIPLPEPARTFLCRAYPVQLEENQNQSSLIGFYDITALKQMDQTRADFVANASHEIRTPLAAISGALETLRGPAEGDKEAQERFLNIIQDHAERINRLIEDLLSLSQIEMKEHHSPADPTDIMTVVNGALEDVHWRTKNANAQITLDSQVQGIRVAADPFSLRRAFLNLLDNAVKYGGSEVSVSVTLQDQSPRGTRAMVKISDNGPGIPEEHLGRLTERFYRVDKARSRALGGTGLGLAIVKHIVHHHQGELSIRSQQGAGTSVLITLPILETQKINDPVNTATKT